MAVAMDNELTEKLVEIGRADNIYIYIYIYIKYIYIYIYRYKKNQRTDF
jgi:type III secretion system FlhB-like substrate exporter